MNIIRWWSTVPSVTGWLIRRFFYLAYDYLVVLVAACFVFWPLFFINLASEIDRFYLIYLIPVVVILLAIWMPVACKLISEVIKDRGKEGPKTLRAGTGHGEAQASMPSDVSASESDLPKASSHLNPFLVLQSLSDKEKSDIADNLANTVLENRASAYDLMSYPDAAWPYTVGELRAAASAINYRLVLPDIDLAAIRSSESALAWEQASVERMDTIDAVPFSLLIDAVEEGGMDGAVSIEPDV